MRQEVLQDFTFHDNHIHGISCVDEDFSCDLILDLDHILEWHCERDPCEFVVAPAWLTFRNVRALVVSITKPELTMNAYLGIIDHVVTEALAAGHSRYEVQLAGGDFLRFEAESVELKVWGAPITSTTQQLVTALRNAPDRLPQQAGH